MKKTFFIYFCITTQLLRTMESPSLNINKNISQNEPTIIKTIDKIDGKGIYFAYYGKNDHNLITMTEQGSYISDIKYNTNEKISDIGFNNNYNNFSVLYRKTTVSPDGNKIIITKKNSIEMFDHTNYHKTQTSLTSKYSIHSVSFDSKNDSLFILIEKNSDSGVLKKYNYNNIFNVNHINKLQTCHPSDFHFAANKSTLCAIYGSTTHKTIVKLYNSSDFTLQKKYTVTQLMQLADPNLNRLDCSIPCQINDDGFVVLVGLNNINACNNRLLIFQKTENNELNFKRSISCKKNLFYNTLFYPTTSIIITISRPSETTKRILQYWNFITGKCLHESLIDDGIHEDSYTFGNISSISVSPNGENIAITTYYPRCTIYNIPTHIANRHAKKIGLNLCLFREFCDQIQTQSGLIPQEIRWKIVQDMLFD